MKLAETEKAMEAHAVRLPQYRSNLEKYTIPMVAVKDYSIRGTKLLKAGDETFAYFNPNEEDDLNGPLYFWATQTNEYVHAKTRALKPLKGV